MVMNKLFFTFISLLMVFSFACKDGKKEKTTEYLTDAKIKLYEKKIEQDPTNYINYDNLAQNYILKARESGDSDFYNKAEDTLNKSLKINSNNYAAMVLYAKTQIAMHEFRKAFSYSATAVKMNPGRSVAYGILGDAYMELGNIDKASESYKRMVEINANLDSYSRVSNLRVVQGRTSEAIEAMEKAYESGLKKSRPKENIAWTQVMLGAIYLNSGNLDLAEKHYTKATEIFDDYYLALEHLAEINKIRGNYKEAENIYGKVIELNPAPEFYLALAEVYENQNRQNESEELNRKVLEIYERKVYKENDNRYLRPLALYYVDNDINLDKALDLAKKDLKIRRDTYVYDTLGWIYYKLGEYGKALKLLNHSLRNGTKDSSLHYHLGMINLKLENIDEAKKHLKLALSINPYFDSEAVNEIKQIINN